MQVDGTIIAERTSENERFYGIEGVRNKQILAGDVKPPQGTLVQLWETLQACEGSAHDQSKLPPPNEQTPGDHEVDEPKGSSQAEYDQLGHDPNERMDTKS